MLFPTLQIWRLIDSFHRHYRTLVSSKTLVCPAKWYVPSHTHQTRAHNELGDPALIHPFLAEIGKDRRKSVDGSADLDTGAAALHLAVRCASGRFLPPYDMTFDTYSFAVETVTLLLSHRAISPNGVHPPGSGTTALHLASSLGRIEIVNLLLEEPGIDDTLRDANGNSCRDVARNKNVTKAIDGEFQPLECRRILCSATLPYPVCQTRDLS